MLKKIITFLFVAVSIQFANAQYATKQLDLKKLDAYFNKAIKDWNVPGMGVAIILNDSVIFAKGYGVTDVTTGEKANENTLFCVASNSKSFTAASIGTLVDDKKLKWDSKVTEFLPWFETYSPYVTEQFTVRDLLCHRSGLETFSGDLIWYASNHNREEVVKRSKYLSPVYGFRAHYGYSNIHYSAAGLVVQAVTGKTWEQYVKENFLNPLGMNRTLTSVSQINSTTNVAQPHNDVDGKLVKIPFVNWDNIAPAGALISSVSDMSKWLRLQMNQGIWGKDTLLSKSVINEMWSMQTPEAVRTENYKNMQLKHFDGYGLGWGVMDYKGYKVVSHSGGYDGMISQTAFLPELKYGFVVLTNSNSYLPAAIFNQLLDEYIYTEEKDWSAKYLDFFNKRKQADKDAKAKEESERNKNTKPTLALQDYVGTYGGTMYGDAEVYLDKGKLKVKFIPTPLFEGELTHWQYDVFSIKLTKVPSLPEGKVQFLLNDKGKVSQMKVDIPNPDFDFKELEFYKK